MLVFLFGAGASHGVGDAGTVKPRLPPQMRELYDNLADDFPSTWGAGSPAWKVRDRIQAIFRRDLY